MKILETTIASALTITITLIAAQGCMSSYGRDFDSPQEKREIREAHAKNKADNERMLTEVRTSKVPDDFEAKINAQFDETLKDPTSKVIEYTTRPIGSLVCGKVNAKNSYGGYTGKKPFFAYFGQDGRLMGLEVDLLQSRFEEKGWGYAYCSKTISCAFYGLLVLHNRCWPLPGN